MSLRTAPVPSPAPAPRRAEALGLSSKAPLLALLMSATLVACGGGGGGGGTTAGNTETPQTAPAPAPAPTPSGPQAVALDAFSDPGLAFHFQVDDSLNSDTALQAAAGGGTFSAWNARASNALFAPGLKVNFYGSGNGCTTGASDGPVGAGVDAELPTVGAATGVTAQGTAAWRWAPSGGFSPCTSDAQGRQGPNMVVLNPTAGSGGGVALYTRSGPDTDGITSLLRPYTSAGQDGSGTNANITGTFVGFRQDWQHQPLHPWVSSKPSLASARVVATQSVAAIDVGNQVVADQPVQAKQQLMVTFVNPTCVSTTGTSPRPCQVNYLFNTAIQRAGVDDWSGISWFQAGNVWFDPAQNGIPVIDGPVKAAGSTVTDVVSGLGLYESRGNATQYAAFQDLNFDLRISFDQLTNVLRIVAGRKLGIAPSAVSDSQMADQWGSTWNQRGDWVLLSTTLAQEVHNPFSSQPALIGGNFKQLYVGPQT
jgi:hypothetical protein